MPIGKGNHPGTNSTYKSDVMGRAARITERRSLYPAQKAAREAPGYKKLGRKDFVGVPPKD